MCLYPHQCSPSLTTIPLSSASNPPPYGIGLADPFKPGGRFTYKIKMSKKVGNFDCKKVKCAVTVRADHLRSEDRSYDLYLPITFK